MAYRNYSVANSFTVDKLGNGDFTTIGSALTAAISGDTIFIRPGTYAENLTLVAGVNLTAFVTDSSLTGLGNVIINGKCTLTAAGTVNISGIELQTNSDFLLTVTGSAESKVNLTNCYLNCLNNTGISFTSSNAISQINVNYCKGNLGTTGIALYSHSSAGTLNIYWSFFTNSGLSTTASNNSSGVADIVWSRLNSAISSTGTAQTSLRFTVLECSLLNTIAFTSGGSSPQQCQNSTLISGTASSISISGLLVCYTCNIVSNNTNAITGAGTINYSGMTFTGTSSTINTTTQTFSGTLQGSKNTAPSPGFLGEQIRSTVASGSAVNLSNGNPVNITNISVTAGIWDISCVGAINSNFATVTVNIISMNTTSATLGTQGDNTIYGTLPVIAVTDGGGSIPSWRQTFNTTTIVYLIIQSNFSGAIAKGYGRISATRVG